MKNQLKKKSNIKITARHWLNPILNTLTPHHTKIFQRYQTIRIVVDFGAAACFVSGSILFLFSTTTSFAARLFLIGSILFAIKPTLDLVRAFHLSKIKTTVKNNPSI